MSEFHECVVGTFDKELQALIDYGHDCCARIDDRIHECCQRIREAHEREIGAFELALRWKDAAPLPQYDVLGNERHKVVCKLRKSDFTLYTPDQFVSTLYKMLYGTEGFPTNIYMMQKGVRDRLIYLLIGDTAEVEDGVDAGRCGDTSAGGDVHAAAGRVDNCAGDQLAEEVTPVTGELRDAMERYRNFKDKSRVKLDEREFDRLCDSIDAVHKDLEHENKELRHDVEMWRDRAEDMRMERDDALKEHHAWAPESHYVMLPKDADGVPIHIGDVMDSKVDYLFDGKPFTVRGLVLCEDGWEVTDGRFGNRYKPDSLRHHHEPTVEDVLHEFVGKALCVSDVVGEDELVTEYAAKLRLVEDSNA